MSRFLAIVMAALLGLALTGCGDDDPTGGPAGPVGPVGPVGQDEGIAGSGVMAAQPRDVSGFDRILLAGEGNVVVALDGAESLTVETDDNLLQYIETAVIAGRLEIRTASGVDIAPTGSVTYRVGAAALSELELAGAGSVQIASWSAEDASVVLSGAGDVTVDGLVATRLEVESTGVGTVTIGGQVDAQTVLAGGVGAYDGSELRSRTATVATRDGGQATVWVTENLEIAVSSLGTISYYGPATVTPTGTGPATYLGDK